MRSTTPYKRGDIVLVSFPFTDLSAAKKRPALIVSPNSFNARQDDLVLADHRQPLARRPIDHVGERSVLVHHVEVAGGEVIR